MEELKQLGEDNPCVKAEADKLAGDVAARQKCGSTCSPSEVNNWLKDLSDLEQTGAIDPSSAKIIEVLLKSHWKTDKHCTAKHKTDKFKYLNIEINNANNKKLSTKYLIEVGI